MDYFVRFIVLNNFGLLACFGSLGGTEKRFKILRPPYKYIQPKSFLKYILRYSNKKQGIVSICFWSELLVLALLLLSNIGFFIIYQFDLAYWSVSFLKLYDLFWITIAGIANLQCRLAMISNNKVFKE